MEKFASVGISKLRVQLRRAKMLGFSLGSEWVLSFYKISSYNIENATNIA